MNPPTELTCWISQLFSTRSFAYNKTYLQPLRLEMTLIKRVLKADEALIFIFTKALALLWQNKMRVNGIQTCLMLTSNSHYTNEMSLPVWWKEKLNGLPHYDTSSFLQQWGFIILPHQQLSASQWNCCRHGKKLLFEYKASHIYHPQKLFVV